MAEIFGTPRADVLVGTDANDLIRGGRGEDWISGGLGDDILYGGLGNDLIEDHDGRSEIWGGRGSDLIDFVGGVAYGGLGNDRIVASDASWAVGEGLGAAIVGGVGSDTISGSGWLWGDQSPGMPEQPGGNDKLSLLPDADGVWANGGLGRDIFTVESGADSFAVIDDFRAGEDKLLAYDNSGDEPENLFWRLDGNGNGVLEWSDSLSGGAVYTDGTDLFLGLDATVSGPSATDATCWLTLRGVTQVSAADWLFPDWLS